MIKDEEVRRSFEKERIEGFSKQGSSVISGQLSRIKVADSI